MRNMTSLGVTVLEKAKLDVITEELIIEDGCDNELDLSRQTIQDIRMSHKKANGTSSDSKSNSGGGSGENSDSRHNQSKPIDSHLSSKLKEDDDIFGHLSMHD